MASDTQSHFISFPLVSGPMIASRLINACPMHVSQLSGMKQKKSKNLALLDDLGRFRLWAHGFDALPTHLYGSPGDTIYPAQTQEQGSSLGKVNIQFDEVLERNQYLKEPTMALLASFASCLLMAKFNKSIHPIYLLGILPLTAT